LSSNTPPSETSTSIEPTNDPEVDLEHTSHTDSHTASPEEYDTSASPSNILQDPLVRQTQVDSAELSPIPSTVALPNRLPRAAEPDHEPQIDFDDTPLTQSWTSPPSAGTIDTDPSVALRDTRVLDPDPNNHLFLNSPLPQPATYIPEDHRKEVVEVKPVRCDYCGIVFDRTCDLK
jgi:hypothetical protein